MKIAILTLTDSGNLLAERIAERLHTCDTCDILGNPGRGRLKELFSRGFSEYRGMICIMATGIVVRMIASFITDKHHDPAVVVVDDAGRYAVSLLSGHEGGANMLASRVAASIDAVPVVTTASDTNRRLILGIGCRAGIEAEFVREAVVQALGSVNAAAGDVRLAATVEDKRDEAGLIEAVEGFGIPLLFVSKRRINDSAREFSESPAARRHLGVKAVAEPCALLSGRDTTLIVPKIIHQGVTVAVVREDAR